MSSVTEIVFNDFPELNILGYDWNSSGHIDRVSLVLPDTSEMWEAYGKSRLHFMRTINTYIQSHHPLSFAVARGEKDLARKREKLYQLLLRSMKETSRYG